MPDRRPARVALGALLGFLAVNALGGGLYAIAGAGGVPIEWLEGSPFSSYFVPGLILFAIVGGVLSVSAYAVFARWHVAPWLAAGSALVLLGWLAVQVSIIGYVSWMQPATAAGALLLLALTMYVAPRSPAPTVLRRWS